MLPVYYDANQNLMLMQTNWASQLNPILVNPVLSGSILKNVFLINGETPVSHLLARMQQGWMITDVSAPATIYRSQPLNNKFLYLTSNAACVVNILVF